MSFRNQVVGPVPPTLAQIVAGTDAAANSAAAAAQATTAATQSTTAANNSAIARIRSMTRVSWTMLGVATSTTATISVTSISRSQVTLLGSQCVNIPAGSADSTYVPAISAVSNTAITLSRQSSGISSDAQGFVEVMEWI